MFNVYDTDTDRFSKIYDEEELVAAVKDSINYYETAAKRYKKLYEEWKKNGMELANTELIDQIQALTEQLHLSYGFFSSQKEKDRYNLFVLKHMHNRLESKANGGKAPYLIPTGTGVGTILKVICPICGESEDITDTEVW